MLSRILTGPVAEQASPILWMAGPAGVREGLAGEVSSGSWGQAVTETPASAEQVGTIPDLHHASTFGLEKQIQELEAELARQYENGRHEGYAAGERAAALAAELRWNAAMERLARGVGDLASYRSRFRKQSEQELLRLALAIAKKILHRELTIDPQALLGVIKAAVEAMNQREILRVRVASEDVLALQSHLEAIGLPSGVEVNGDRSLERGSVLIDTHRGVTDASLHTQLDEIERGFVDRMDAA